MTHSIKPAPSYGYHEWMRDVWRALEAIKMTPEQRASPGTVRFYPHYVSNTPVKFDLPHWPACDMDLDGVVDLLGPETFVQVQMNRCADPDYEMGCARHVRTVPMEVFADDVVSGPPNDTYMTARNRGANAAALAPLWPRVGPLPEFLQPNPAAGYVWLGRGALTPLHHDATNNLLCEVFGPGRVVRLCPPEYRDRLSPNGGQFGDTTFQQMGFYSDVVLHPGEALFIPVGWWHAVQSLGDSPGMMISYTNFVWPNYWGRGVVVTRPWDWRHEYERFTQFEERPA